MNLFNRTAGYRQNSKKRNASIHHNSIFSSYLGYFTLHTCIITRKSSASTWGKLRHCQNENVFNSHASFQSSPKINRMLITRRICIQWKSSQVLSPVSTVSVRNAWKFALLFATDRRKKKTLAFLESRFATASSTKKPSGLAFYWWIVNN